MNEKNFRTIEAKENTVVEWMYPEIYDKPDVLLISLFHTRATDGIFISFDAKRDGWVIQQEEILERKGFTCSSGIFHEVAFIPSWQYQRGHEKQTEEERKRVRSFIKETFNWDPEEQENQNEFHHPLR